MKRVNFFLLLLSFNDGAYLYHESIYSPPRRNISPRLVGGGLNNSLPNCRTTGLQDQFGTKLTRDHSNDH